MRLKSYAVRKKGFQNRNFLRAINGKKILWRVLWTALTAGISFIILYPLIVKLNLSFMLEKDLYDPTVRYVARNFTIGNYELALLRMNYFESFKNTFLISLSVSLLQVASCTLVAYGFARFAFPLKKLLFGLVVLTLVVPPQAMMVPLFIHFRYFDVFGIIGLITGTRGVSLLDSYWPFMLLSLTANGMKNGLYIYIIRQFFRGMPKELEEASYVDGAGLFRTFWRVMLPNAVPILVTSFLFSFVWQWNDLFYSTLFLQKVPMLATSLSGLIDNISQNVYWDTGMFGSLTPAYKSMMSNTGSLLVIAPLVLIYLFAQRYFVESIERAGIVG